MSYSYEICSPNASQRQSPSDSNCECDSRTLRCVHQWQCDSDSADSTLKRVLRELKILKCRLSRAEDELSLLHQVVKLQSSLLNIDQDHRACRTNSVSSDSVHSFKLHTSTPTPTPAPAPALTSTSTSASACAFMLNNHAWYGEAFLFEIMCQYKNFRPAENNFYNSVFAYYTMSNFAKFIRATKRFHHTCVLSVGYSDLFEYNSYSNSKRGVQASSDGVNGSGSGSGSCSGTGELHNVLNHMYQCGAKRIKMLSVPPARQMMKNLDYLRLCQTNNRALMSVAEKHRVEFINLDSLFVKNSDEFFSYFDNDQLNVQVLDNLSMRKNGDQFVLHIASEMANCLIDFITNFSGRASDVAYINRRIKGYSSREHIPLDSSARGDRQGYKRRSRTAESYEKENERCTFSHDQSKRRKKSMNSSHFDRQMSREIINSPCSRPTIVTLNANPFDRDERENVDYVRRSYRHSPPTAHDKTDYHRVDRTNSSLNEYEYEKNFDRYRIESFENRY